MELTPKERSVLRDDLSAPVALVLALGRDEHFWSLVAQVAGASDARRAELAAELVPPYTRNHQPAKKAIARLLLTAADAHPNRTRGRTFIALECGITATMPDADLIPGDSRRAFQERAIDQIHLGVEAIVRRGAGRCVECGRPLAGPRTVGSARRRAWRDYCEACEGRPEGEKAVPERKLGPAVKLVLDALAAQVVPGNPSRARARRATRSGPWSSGGPDTAETS